MRKKKKDRDEWKERRRSLFEFGAEKARVGHKSGERWIALYSPQLSAGLDRGRLEKRIFSRPECSHRLVKLAYIALVQRRWRTPLDALANCCIDIGYQFVQFARQ